MTDPWSLSFFTVAAMVVVGYVGFVARGMEPERALALVVGSALALGILMRVTLSIAFPSADKNMGENLTGPAPSEKAPTVNSGLEEHA